jgi:hypothetical protein
VFVRISSRLVEIEVADGVLQYMIFINQTRVSSLLIITIANRIWLGVSS